MGAPNGDQGQVVRIVLQMLQGQAGGIAGVLSSFERVGLGGVAHSWIHEGPNQPVSPGQVSQALPGPVGDLASKLGVSEQEAAGRLAGSFRRSWTTSAQAAKLPLTAALVV